MTKTFRLCSTPKPNPLHQLPLLHKRMLRLALQKFQHSQIYSIHPLSISNQPFKKDFETNSRTLHLALARLTKKVQILRSKSSEVSSEVSKSNADHPNYNSKNGQGSRALLVNANDLKCRVSEEISTQESLFNDRTTKRVKKTKGPSLKKLSVLEFKKNKRLTNFFKAKRKELNELNQSNTSQKKSNLEIDLYLSQNQGDLDSGPIEVTRSNPFSVSAGSIHYEQQISTPVQENIILTESKRFPNNVNLNDETESILLSTTPYLLKIFELTRTQSTHWKRRKGVGRDAKGLRLMSKALIRLLSNNPNKRYTLDQICSQIQVEKRKIYDLINILTSIRMINKVSKGIYKWQGIQPIVSFLRNLPSFEALTIKLKQEKSLSSMCYCFLAYMKTNKQSNIELAAESLTVSGPQEYSQQTICFRSKVRRLYDISKILTTVGLIENISQNKKPLLRWVGIQNMQSVLHIISSSSECESPKQVSIREILANVQNTLKNSVVTVHPEDVQRKRIESIDMNIIEKYLMGNSGFIVPNASVIVPDL